MSPGASRNSVRSCPTQNPRPAPVMTTARTSSSRAASFRAAWSARCIAALKAFRTSGRFSVIVWTAPSRELSTSDTRRVCHLREPAFEEPALEWLVRELESRPIGLRGVVQPAESPEQIRPRRMKQVVPLEPLDPLHELEAPLRAVGERHCDRPVQLDHRRRLPRREDAVEARDLAPVRLRLRVEGGDRRLHLIRAATTLRERSVEHAPPLVDLRAVPERAILPLEQHELGSRAGVAPRVLEEHQREQPERLGL